MVDSTFTVKFDDASLMVEVPSKEIDFDAEKQEKGEMTGSFKISLIQLFLLHTMT